MDVLNSHQRDMPVPPSERCGVNKGLEAIVMQCLSKEPKERPADGAALCEAIEGVPGFSAQDAKRRSSISTSHEAVETADTLRPAAKSNQSTLVDMRVGPALAHTYDISSSTAQHDYQQALLTLAKAVVEGGCKDTKLVMCFASLHQAAESRQKHTDRLSKLFDEGEKLDQRFRKDQSALRFELNDLFFQAAESSPRMDQSKLDAMANDLTEDLIRVEYKYDRALRAVVDAEITETAQREALEDSMTEQYCDLLHLVDCNIESVTLTQSMEKLVNAFQDAKIAYDQWLRQRA